MKHLHIYNCANNYEEKIIIIADKAALLDLKHAIDKAIETGKAVEDEFRINNREEFKLKIKMQEDFSHVPVPNDVRNDFKAFYTYILEKIIDE